MPLCAAEGVKPLSLAESIDLALKQSVLIHAAKEGVRGAEAQKREAFTGFLPKFSTSYSYTRYNRDPYLNFPGMPPFVQAGTLTVGTKDNYNWILEARQPLFAGGTILANYEASRIGADIARLDEAASVQDLVLEVKTAYFNILKAGRILAVAKQSLDQLQAHRDTAQNFYDQGLIPRNDLLYAEVELANGRQFLLRAENGLELARSKFNTLLRRPINAPVEIEDILNDRPYEKTIDACIAAALDNRPEIRSFALRLEQAKSQVKVSQGRLLSERQPRGELRKIRRHAGRRGQRFQGSGELVRHGGRELEFLGVGEDQKPRRSRTEPGEPGGGLPRQRPGSGHPRGEERLSPPPRGGKTGPGGDQGDRAGRGELPHQHRAVPGAGGNGDRCDRCADPPHKAKSDRHNALGDFSISRARLERAMGVVWGGTE